MSSSMLMEVSSADHVCRDCGPDWVAVLDSMTVVFIVQSLHELFRHVPALRAPCLAAACRLVRHLALRPGLSHSQPDHADQLDAFSSHNIDAVRSRFNLSLQSLPFHGHVLVEFFSQEFQGDRGRLLVRSVPLLNALSRLMNQFAFFENSKHLCTSSLPAHQPSAGSAESAGERPSPALNLDAVH
jgi:hypothetical protein